MEKKGTKKQICDTSSFDPLDSIFRSLRCSRSSRVEKTSEMPVGRVSNRNSIFIYLIRLAAFGCEGLLSGRGLGAEEGAVQFKAIIWGTRTGLCQSGICISSGRARRGR